jgi:hypothetical protein
MADKFFGAKFEWWFGVVEDVNDPLLAGRVRVRVYDYHTQDKGRLPTADLPWAQVILPPTSASTSDVGSSGTGLLTGSYVVGMWIDNIHQTPMVLGSINGIPLDKPNKELGFNDPLGQIPRRTEEPDVNRLARNDKQYLHPVIQKKEEGRTANIPVANIDQPWNEPIYAYAPQYPKNQVFESESGHIFETDDTPLHERIHEYHKSGTFYEIDQDGNKVTRIVGNDYQVIAGSNYVNVKGNVNLTIDNDCRTYIKGNWNIQVDGDVVENIKGTLTQTVDGEVSETYKKSQATNIGVTLDVNAGTNIDLDAPRIDFNKER